MKVPDPCLAAGWSCDAVVSARRKDPKRKSRIELAQDESGASMTDSLQYRPPKVRDRWFVWCVFRPLVVECNMFRI
jgi:hypothetical protein